MHPEFRMEDVEIPKDPFRAGRDTLRLEALGLMTAGIVHDLGNMIQVLSSAMSILNRHPGVRAAEGLEPVVASAVQSLERATALIGMIAGFGRAGDCETEELDVGLCLAGLERLLGWITAGSIRFDLRVSPFCPRVACSRRQFENALLNLVLNARDAMPGGGVLTIDAMACGAAASGAAGQAGDAIISVTDTGEGMDAYTLSRAFEPFFTTKPGGRGTGLGLAMVRRFAQEAGGGVAARSRPGVGTTVSLTLPAVVTPFGWSAGPAGMGPGPCAGTAPASQV
ncbi:MAG: ATP-binding protein [Alphaproteobacteria bacterium]|nr:ATP-binding protein [Alphaproteobacteria bacterium]MBU1516588.1 ATP-binding protein [Alphaproteobacteria bacterium]MBU2094345.1 ATP-binding protein [Alphaproteobacteria bacterium]MBU2153229.1 ATP-binding protein [Alphaproteobacteria bacterium]MBU2307515.1 ATP-binding protein [Alphaproteobacteria bacterium]